VVHLERIISSYMSLTVREIFFFEVIGPDEGFPQRL
jgi:hypothetical protein